MLTMERQPLCSASPANAGKMQGSAGSSAERDLVFIMNFKALGVRGRVCVKRAHCVERLFLL
jgi:hypothetical protein